MAIGHNPSHPQFSIPDHFKKDLEGYKVNKPAIQLPHNRPLPVGLMKRMIAFRKKENLLVGKGKGRT